MKKRNLGSLLLLGLLLVTSAPAQDCVVGLYMDVEGTIGDSFMPQPFFPFDVYAVMHVESTVAGVAYVIEVPTDFHFNAVSYGPSGGGLNVPGSGGDNIGLGECGLGFNNNPILVAHYSVWHSTTVTDHRIIPIGPNVDEDLLFPVYADCADHLIVCEGTSSLYLYGAAVDDRSIGAVKALYGD